jgi:hypothetical protein
MEVEDFYIPLPLLSSKWTLLSNTCRLILSLELLVYKGLIYINENSTLKVKSRPIIKEEL